MPCFNLDAIFYEVPFVASDPIHTYFIDHDIYCWFKYPGYDNMIFLDVAPVSRESVNYEYFKTKYADLFNILTKYTNNIKVTLGTIRTTVYRYSVEETFDAKYPVVYAVLPKLFSCKWKAELYASKIASTLPSYTIPRVFVELEAGYRFRAVIGVAFVDDAADYLSKLRNAINNVVPKAMSIVRNHISKPAIDMHDVLVKTLYRRFAHAIVPEVFEDTATPLKIKTSSKLMSCISGLPAEIEKVLRDIKYIFPNDRSKLETCTLAINVLFHNTRKRKYDVIATVNVPVYYADAPEYRRSYLHYRGVEDVIYDARALASKLEEITKEEYYVFPFDAVDEDRFPYKVFPAMYIIPKKPVREHAERLAAIVANIPVEDYTFLAPPPDETFTYASARERAIDNITSSINTLTPKCVNPPEAVECYDECVAPCGKYCDYYCEPTCETYCSREYYACLDYCKRKCNYIPKCADYDEELEEILKL